MIRIKNGSALRKREKGMLKRGKGGMTGDRKSTAVQTDSTTTGQNSVPSATDGTNVNPNRIVPDTVPGKLKGNIMGLSQGSRP
jgi:hypothetical protein